MKTIIIADSGSTKTDWRIIDVSSKKTVNEVVTGGINPYFMTEDDIVKTIKEQWDTDILLKNIQKIYFYGAGCSSESKCKIVNQGLHRFFSSADIYVYHDLLAAARALFGQEEGIAAILGTGSNSCLYRHMQVEEEIFSLGYLFGDKGSGGHIGRKIVDAYLKDEMPDRLTLEFQKNYPLTKEQILDNVYNKPSPNRFLASFSEFASNNFEAAFIQQIIKNSFRDFFDYQITRYTNYQRYPLRVVGSVGFYFRNIMEDVASEYDMKVDRVIQNPVENLVQFHLSDLP
ncbi:MAG: N-acetylglucosamine kinase [Bacteroidota bacterium]